MNITGWPPEIDISLIIYRKPIIKKYTLASLENYSIMLMGKNDKQVYLEVDI